MAHWTASRRRLLFLKNSRLRLAVKRISHAV